MEAASLLLLSIESKIHLTMYVGMMVLISAFAGFNLCWFVVYFRVSCCTTTCGRRRRGCAASAEVVWQNDACPICREWNRITFVWNGIDSPSCRNRDG